MSKTKNLSAKSDNLPHSIFSFFAGAGFLDLGFEHMGFDVVFANEVHKPFAEAYEYARQQLGIPLPKDGVSVASIDDFAEGNAGFGHLVELMDAERARGQSVGFIGGPPCPDFSVGGKNAGKDGENGRLSKSYVDLICATKPDFFIFENVKGLWRTSRHREFYDQLKSQLKSAGYSMSDRLINSLEYGAPQERERIILFGWLGDSYAGTSPPAWESYFKYAPDFLSKLTWPKAGEAAQHVGVPEDLTVGYWFNKNAVDSHANASHAFKPRAGLVKFQTILEGDDSRKSYKRLHSGRYSPTAAYGNNEVHIHPTLPRRISAAEALAIQSLPSEFVLPPNMTLSNMFKTVGNGVPYLAAVGIARMVAEHLQNGARVVQDPKPKELST